MAYIRDLTDKDRWVLAAVGLGGVAYRFAVGHARYPEWWLGDAKVTYNVKKLCKRNLARMTFNNGVPTVGLYDRPQYWKRGNHR